MTHFTRRIWTSFPVALAASMPLTIACSSGGAGAVNPFQDGGQGPVGPLVDGGRADVTNPTDECNASTPHRDGSEALMEVAQCTQSGGGSTVINLQVPASIVKGDRMKIDWSITGGADPSSLAMFLVRNVPEGQSNDHAGSTGPIFMRAKNVCGTASGVADWDGVSTGCAPTDAPTFCAGVEPGEYAIKAILYEEQDVRLVYGHEPSPATKPTVLAEVSSSPFTITGPPNLAPIRGRLQGAVTRRIAEFADAYYFAGTRLDRYAETTCTLDGPDGEGKYCGTFELGAPFEGTLRACVSLRTTDAPSVNGDIRYRAGVLPYGDAVARAKEIADKPYRPRVGEGTTYLSSGVTNWSYRAESGGHWLFVVHEIKAGGTEDGPDRFADNVLVRVANDGNACVVKTVGYKEQLAVDIFADTVACP